MKPAGGRLTLLGETVDGRADLRRVRRGLGYLPQQFGFYPRFTVREGLLTTTGPIHLQDGGAAARDMVG